MPSLQPRGDGQVLCALGSPGFGSLYFKLGGRAVNPDLEIPVLVVAPDFGFAIAVNLGFAGAGNDVAAKFHLGVDLEGFGVIGAGVFTLVGGPFEFNML